MYVRGVVTDNPRKRFECTQPATESYDTVLSVIMKLDAKTCAKEIQQGLLHDRDTPVSPSSSLQRSWLSQQCHVQDAMSSLGSVCCFFCCCCLTVAIIVGSTVVFMEVFLQLAYPRTRPFCPHSFCTLLFFFNCLSSKSG